MPGGFLGTNQTFRAESTQMIFFKFYNSEITPLLIVLVAMAFTTVSIRAEGQIIDKEISQFTYGGLGAISEIKPARLNPNALHIYANPDWQTGKINSYGNETLENVPMRYDIIRNRLVLLVENDLKALYGRHVRSFEWLVSSQNRKVVYINCEEFMFKEEDLTGFLEVLAEGEYSLFSHKVIKIFQGNSSTSLSGSHRKDDIYALDHYYTMQEGFVVSLPKKRKALFDFFSEYETEIKKFINKNGLLLKRKPDLIKIFEYLNKLSSQKQP